TRRSASVCCVRSRASAAIARARASRSAASGLATDDRAVATDIAAIVARMERSAMREQPPGFRHSASKTRVNALQAPSGLRAAATCLLHPMAARRLLRSVLAINPNNNRRRKTEAEGPGGNGVTAEAAAFAAPVAKVERAARL